MPNWVKVRSDLSPSRDGYIMLDKTNLQTAAATGDTSWTTLSIAAGASANWSVTSANPLRVRKDANGIVHVMGTAKKTSGAFGSASALGAMFVLPAGYRPYATGSAGIEGRTYFGCYGSSGVAGVYVLSNGEVWCPNHTAASGDIIEFSPISFFAEN